MSHFLALGSAWSSRRNPWQRQRAKQQTLRFEESWKHDQEEEIEKKKKSRRKAARREQYQLIPLCGLVECQKRRDSQRQDTNSTCFILILLNLFIWSTTIIRFCILPTSLAGAAKTAEKCSGQSNNNKYPRAPSDFPCIVSDSLREASEAQTSSDSVQNPRRVSTKPESRLRVLLPFDSAFERQA